MRRTDREITRFEELVAIMEECDVCRLALNDEGYPYLLPLNFGMQVTGQGAVELYFHGAATGTKLTLIARDNRASFEMDCGHRLVTEPERRGCTMEYRSVVGRGRIELVPEEEKYGALCLLMAHYHREASAIPAAAIPRTAVFKLVVEQMTGKAHTVGPKQG